MERADWIDAHVHVWAGKASSYPRTANGPDYTPDEFTPEKYLGCASAAGIAQAVLVQMSFYGRDHRYLLEAVGRHRGRFAPVGLLCGSDWAEELERLGADGMRAFRVVFEPANADDYAGLWREAGARGYTLCLLSSPEALPVVDRLCAAGPDTRVVVDHLGRIGMDGQIGDENVGRLCRLARHARVFVKVSAFYALGLRRPPYTDIVPLIERVYEAFGADRLMWGSDAPFQLDAPHDCAASVELVRDRLPFLGAREREAVLRGTAASVFFGEGA